MTVLLDGLLFCPKIMYNYIYKDLNQVGKFSASSGGR